MNEYTLTDIKTKKGLVHYGTRNSSKSEFNLCAIVLFSVNFSHCITEIQRGCVNAMQYCSEYYQSVDRLVSQSVSWSVGRLVNQSFGRSVSESVSQ